MLYIRLCTAEETEVCPWNTLVTATVRAMLAAFCLLRLCSNVLLMCMITMLMHIPCYLAQALPVDQDLANLDALAAGTQGILHGLPTPDDAHTTQPLRKIHTHIR